MKSSIKNAFLSFLLFSLAPVAWGEGHAELLQRYAMEAGEPLSAERGKELWENQVEGRSCATCHNKDITTPGRRKVFFFYKSIKPMALSVSPKRYNDAEMVEKAFDRNCNRIFLRTCTAKEKGDILTYLTSK